MDSEIVKGKPLTREETKYLLELIESSKIITSKTTNATNNKMKNEEWFQLTHRFNATATNCRRTPQQLRLKWENLKKNARKRSTRIRMNQMKTGGGPPDYIPPDDILDRVTALLGSTASGYTVPFGGDKEPVVCDIDEGGSNGDGDSIGDVDLTMLVVDSSNNSALVPIENGVETVVNEVLDVVDQNITPNKTKRFTFTTPRAVKKKFKPDEGRTTRNLAIAEYYTNKKQGLDAKLVNLNLENESLKLKNIQLTLQNEKLRLETEKLKLELAKLS